VFTLDEQLISSVANAFDIVKCTPSLIAGVSLRNEQRSIQKKSYRAMSQATSVATSGGPCSHPAFDYNMQRMALSVTNNNPAAKPNKATAPLPKYRPDGRGARDTWVYEPVAANPRDHILTREERYWQTHLGKPEHRGKCAKAVASTTASDRIHSSRKKQPLIPAVALKQLAALPPLQRSTRSNTARVHAEETNRMLCDKLAAQLLPTATARTRQY
jgi:hypothetical protein